MAAAVEGFPEEVMTFILLKLPVKSLLRFKCVQKSWYSLINSPYFIHLHRSSSSSSQCFILRRYTNLRRHVLSFYSYETLDNLGPEITLPFSNVGVVSLSGSCDGLVCMTDHVDQIILCNPTIPVFRSLAFPPPLGNRSCYCIHSVAFGSDPNTGQYKVLMVGAPYDYDDYYDYDDREARLYDFSTDTWRKTAAVISPGPFRYNKCAASLNGAFHWCPLDKSDNILTFHMTNEVTGFIPLPDFVLVNVFCQQKRVFVSSKSQLSLVLINDLSGGEFEICVMTEYGIKESWTRLFRIRRRPDDLRLLPFWDEQRLLLRNKAQQLFSWKFQNQNLCYFPIDPIDGCCDVCPYSQSLVSVKSLNQLPFVVL